MFALICLLAIQAVWARPQFSHIDPASHILIVTPQAQVQLEPAVRYVHGLSPLARIAAPHREETIVYVPAGSAASIVPSSSAAALVPAGSAASIVPLETVGTGRANNALAQKPTAGAAGAASGASAASAETKQFDQIQQNIEQIQQQIQQGAEAIAPSFAEAAAAAAAAASSAGANFFPSFSPPSSSSGKDDNKLKVEKIELYETPANTLPLLPTNEARQFYSVAPIYQPHTVELVRAPVYLTPLSAIRARSIQQADLPLIELKTEQEQKSESLPLQNGLKEQITQPERQEILEAVKPATAAATLKASGTDEANADSENKTDIARFLEANALKEESKAERTQQQNANEQLKSDDQQSVPLNKISEAQQPQLRVVPAVVDDIVASEHHQPIVV